MKFVSVYFHYQKTKNIIPIYDKFNKDDIILIKKT